MTSNNGRLGYRRSRRSRSGSVRYGQCSLAYWYHTAVHIPCSAFFSPIPSVCLIRFPLHTGTVIALHAFCSVVFSSIPHSLGMFFSSFFVTNQRAKYILRERSYNNVRASSSSQCHIYVVKTYKHGTGARDDDVRCRVLENKQRLTHR